MQIYRQGQKWVCDAHHALSAAGIQFAHVITLSADTDIFILAIYYWKELEKCDYLGIWFDSSHTKKYFLGCHLAAESLSKRMCNILPALHAIRVVMRLADSAAKCNV